MIKDDNHGDHPGWKQLSLFPASIVLDENISTPLLKKKLSLLGCSTITTVPDMGLSGGTDREIGRSIETTDALATSDRRFAWDALSPDSSLRTIMYIPQQKLHDHSTIRSMYEAFANTSTGEHPHTIRVITPSVICDFPLPANDLKQLVDAGQRGRLPRPLSNRIACQIWRTDSRTATKRLIHLVKAGWLMKTGRGPGTKYIASAQLQRIQDLGLLDEPEGPA